MSIGEPGFDGGPGNPPQERQMDKENEKNEAKALAKKKGMTLQGWAAQLIRKKLEEDREAVNG